MKIFKILLTLGLIFVSILTLQAVIPHSEFLYYGAIVFTTPAAAGTYAFNLNYIPQFLIYDHAAAPLTNLSVRDQTDGTILDLPLAGIAQVAMFMRFSEAVTTVRRFRLANGHIQNKNVTVTIVQPGAVAINFQACSDAPGNTTFKYTPAAILAGQPMPFMDFTALFLPGLAAGDTVFVEYKSGHSQLFDGPELLELTSQYQSSQIATGFILNNINAYIHRATVNQAIAGAAYVMSVNVKR